MKKVGIFHSVPTVAELQKNYLYFDEIQTSFAFLKGTLSSLDSLKLTDRKKKDSHRFLSELEKLVDLEVLTPKEDIEQRILPVIGSFDSERIGEELSRQIDTFDLSDQEQSLLKYFESLSRIKRNYDLEISGLSEIRRIDDSSPKSKFVIVNPDFSNLLTGQIKEEDFERRMKKKRHRVKIEEQIYSQIKEGAEIYSRVASTLLNSYFKDSTYVPIVGSFSKSISLPTQIRSEAITLVVNRFPVPDQGVDWEKIIQFKQDEKSMQKLRNLRIWVEDLSGSVSDLSYFKDRLEQIIYEYEEQLKIHKIKYVTSGLESIIVPIMEVMENLVTFKWSDAAKAIFKVNKRTVEMLEDEAKLNGREIAYISSIRKKFN